MENALFLTLLLLLAELFEAWLQKSPTLFGVLEKLYRYYKQSIFLFFSCTAWILCHHSYLLSD